MRKRIMDLIRKSMSYVNGLRPCRQTLGAVEQNAQASRELSCSIARLTDTLTGDRLLQRRATDRETDEGWRQRRVFR